VGASVPASAHDISGVTGRAGYAGIPNDCHGNLYLVEDGGGRGGPTTPNAMHRTHSSIPICAVTTMTASWHWGSCTHCRPDLLFIGVTIFTRRAIAGPIQ
jgi:hypothetical protein